MFIVTITDVLDRGEFFMYYCDNKWVHRLKHMCVPASNSILNSVDKEPASHDDSQQVWHNTKPYDAVVCTSPHKQKVADIVGD